MVRKLTFWIMNICKIWTQTHQSLYKPKPTVWRHCCIYFTKAMFTTNFSQYSFHFEVFFKISPILGLSVRFCGILVPVFHILNSTNFFKLFVCLISSIRSVFRVIFHISRSNCAIVCALNWLPKQFVLGTMKSDDLT